MSDGKRQKMDLDRVLAQVISIVARHNPGELTYSKIARITGIPRPTLYYYFGNSPKNLLDEAVKYGMQRFVLLYNIEETKKLPDWKTFQRKRLIEVVQFVKRFPWAPRLYFRYRNHPDWSENIQKIEDKYCEKIAEAWKQYEGTNTDPRAVRLTGYIKLGLLWGLATEPQAWNLDQNEKLADIFADRLTDIVTDIMKLQFPS